MIQYKQNIILLTVVDAVDFTSWLRHRLVLMSYVILHKHTTGHPRQKAKHNQSTQQLSDSMFWHQVVLMFAVATNTHPIPETESHDFASKPSFSQMFKRLFRWSIDCTFLAPGGAYGCNESQTHIWYPKQTTIVSVVIIKFKNLNVCHFPQYHKWQIKAWHRW